MNQLLTVFTQGRLFGHPIHSMLVHFPSALFPIAFIFDCLALATNNNALAISAFYSMAAGVIMGIVAILFGFIDYYHLPTEHIAWKKAGIHALINCITLCVFLVLVALRMKTYPLIPFSTIGELLFSFLGVVCLIVGNFLGGELVFRHHVGITDVEELPKEID